MVSTSLAANILLEVSIYDNTVIFIIDINDIIILFKL